MTTETVVREWGSSLGVVIPHDVVKKKKIGIGDTVDVVVVKKKNVLTETFGMLKNWKKPTQEIMDEVNQEFWGE